MRVLGLDLGPNSIGWAIIDPDECQIVASGVRVFPEGVDAFDTAKEKSRTQERRVKRGMRRQIARRARRKRKLRKLLEAHELLPSHAEQQATVLSLDPYSLRAKGLDQPLKAYELGRVLLHLAARRGFLSNSKSDKSKAKETSEMLKEISELENEIQRAGHRTLGEHLAFLVAKPGEKPHNRIRSKHTRRKMVRKEFDLLWSVQRDFHPSILTDDLKKKLDNPKGNATWWMGGAIFGQRNLYCPASMVGMCEFEARERRAPKSDRIAQRYRLLSEVNNLKFIDPDSGQVCSLDHDQRSILIDHLSKTKEMTFEQARKKLNFPRAVHFNLEEGERTKLKGHLVDYLMAKESPFGKEWWDLPDAQKDVVVRTINNPRNTDDMVKDVAIREWRLTLEQADQLLSINLPDGYGSLSRKAMEKLVPFMEKGLLLMTDDGTPCALNQAGYLRPDQRPHKQLDALPEPPELPNPVVRNTLHELRRLVNAIIAEKKYGKPDRIHVELARTIKMGPKDRSDYNKARREREEERSRAADAIRNEATGIKLSRALIDKYLMWEQQGGKCVYSGKSISLRQLLGGDIDVDHILPRWRSLDDSFGNKVVCFRDMNRAKGDHTPYEWMSGRNEEYEAMKQRISILPFRKRARFTQENIDTDEFAARQLVDTSYVTRAAAEYVRCLVEKPHHVLGGKGMYTAELRHLWGIETILSELPDSPAWVTQADLRPGEKNRADHRHHAIDAIVVALTDRSRLQKLSTLYKTGEAGAEILPWEDFRNSVVDSMKNINVSHHVQRKISGALHKDTIYGVVHKKTIQGKIVAQPGQFVSRKPLEDLTQAMVEDIRDPTIKQLVVDRLMEFNVKAGKKSAAGIPKEAWAKPLLMKSGIPVKKVRLVTRDETICRIREGAYVKPGSTHHLCLFEWTEKGKKKRDAVFVTMLEAVQRIKEQKPIICRVHPKKPEARFIMSLSRGELILATFKGKKRIVRFKTAASTTQQIIFADSTDARRDSGDNMAEKLSATPDSLDKEARKVTVDRLGRIRWAND